MTTLPDEQSSEMQNKYDPFQELRTMPGGWDLSSILKPLPVAPKPGFLPDQSNAEEDNTSSPSDQI